MKNKYLVLNQPGKFERKENTIDLKLLEGEALVKIKKIGVCGTDYHAFKGNQPFFTYPRVLWPCWVLKSLNCNLNLMILQLEIVWL